MVAGTIGLVLGFDELGQRVGRLHHGRNDVVHPIQPAGKQVGDSLATANLQRDLEIGSASQLEKAQELVGARSFGFEFRLDGNNAMLVTSTLQKIEHLCFDSVHLLPPWPNYEVPSRMLDAV